MFRTCSGLRHTAGASVVVLLLAACRPDATAPMASIATEARQFVSGASLTVSNTNATGRGSLSEALANAQRGDKIVFAEKLAGQTIPLAATIETTMALHFEGPVAGNVILDAGGQFRVWHNASGLDTVVIRRVTLRGGTTSAAGTILQTSGGGLMVDEGQVICERCVFTENSAQYGGGVAVLNFGKLDARLSRAMRNTAVMAGGIGTGFGELKLTRSRVDSNSATLTGGGLQLRGATEIDRSTIMFNRAAGSGAGLQVREGVFRMRNSAVTYNDASIGANIIGAGMTVETGADVRLDHVAIFDNDPRASFGSAINTIVPITVANSYLGGTPVSCNDPTKIVHAGRNGVFDTSCGAAGPRVLVTNPFILYPTIEQDLQTVYRLRTDSPLIDAGLDCTLTEDQLGLTRTVGASCDIGPVEYNTFPTATLAIAASATVSRISGAVQLGGTITCTGAGSVSLAVGLEQMQKIGKSSNTVSGNSTTTAVCANGTVSWSTVVVPSSGGFTSGSGSATVRATGGTALPAAAAGSVKLGWSR